MSLDPIVLFGMLFKGSSCRINAAPFPEAPRRLDLISGCNWDDLRAEIMHHGLAQPGRRPIGFSTLLIEGGATLAAAC